MDDTPILPAGFDDLKPLAAQWARATEAQRNQIRWNADADAFASFYNVMMPRLDAALAHLSGCPAKGMDEPSLNLFNLVAAFAEASPHHELYGGSPDVPFSFSARRFVPGHGDTPSWQMA